MTAVYERFGIKFLYPENWVISDEQASGWPRSVSVQSPTGAFWSITVHHSTDSPDELQQHVLRTMHDEYTEFEAEPLSEQIGDCGMTGYDMNFYCLDLLVSAGLRTFRLDKRVIMVMFQAEDREFQGLEPVFRAITTSLIQSINSADR